MSDRAQARLLRSWSAVSLAIAMLLLTAPARAALGGTRLFQARPSGLPEAAGAETVAARCLTCHRADILAAQRLSMEGWAREVDKMAGWGARVEAGERAEIIQYLAGQFGMQRSAPGPRDPTAASLLSRCLVCHDGRLIERQRLSRDAWKREVDKMRSWGAAVTESEAAILSDDLARQFAPER